MKTRLYKYLKENFPYSPVDFDKDLIASYEMINHFGKIDVQEVLRPRTWHGKTHSAEQRLAQFMRKNKARTKNGYIIAPYNNDIINLIECHLENREEEVKTKKTFFEGQTPCSVTFYGQTFKGKVLIKRKNILVIDIQ